MKLLHVPSGVLYIAEKPEHSSCLAVLDLSGHESNIEVDLSSTRSSPYSTCCLVSMNLGYKEKYTYLVSFSKEIVKLRSKVKVLLEALSIRG